MLRNIPHLALPLVILWFGIEEEAKLFLVAIGVLFPVYLNTFHGIRSVDSWGGSMDCGDLLYFATHFSSRSAVHTGWHPIRPRH